MVFSSAADRLKVPLGEFLLAVFARLFALLRRLRRGSPRPL